MGDTLDHIDDCINEVEELYRIVKMLEVLVELEAAGELDDDERRLHANKINKMIDRLETPDTSDDSH